MRLKIKKQQSPHEETFTVKKSTLRLHGYPVGHKVYEIFPAGANEVEIKGSTVMVHARGGVAIDAMIVLDGGAILLRCQVEGEGLPVFDYWKPVGETLSTHERGGARKVRAPKFDPLDED